jgi:hypothetical protein
LVAFDSGWRGEEACALHAVVGDACTWQSTGVRVDRMGGFVA